MVGLLYFGGCWGLWVLLVEVFDELWGKKVLFGDPLIVLRFSVPLLYTELAWDLGVHLVTSPHCQGTLLSHLLSDLLLNAFQIT